MRKIAAIAFSLMFYFISCETGDDPVDSDIYQNTDKIEIEISLDGVSYRLDYSNSPDPDFINGVEFYVEFTSVAGTSYYDDETNVFYTEFDNPVVLGKLVRGYMSVQFDLNANECLYVIEQTRSFESLISGDVLQEFDFGHRFIPFNQSYIDQSSGQEVLEFLLEGAVSCSDDAGFSFTEMNDNYTEKIINVECGEASYVKVRVYL